MVRRGVVAAGHPVTAEVGAELLRAGGNAVDAAVAAVLASFVAEPLLTGLGAGGYLLVAPPGQEPTLLDFFVTAPGLAADPANRAPLVPVEVSFGDAVQAFHVGAASVGTFGAPAGIVAAVDRFGSAPLRELAAPAVRLARRGVRVNGQQAYLFSILAGILTSSPEARAHYLVDDRLPREGDLLRAPELADSLVRLATDGAAPFYGGDIGRAVTEWITDRGGLLTPEDLSGYEVVPREPVRVRYRDRDVHTNPPPSAGGVLLGYALAALGRTPGPPGPAELLAAMAAAQAERTPAFLDDLAEPGFLDGYAASRLGSTTHISVLDADGGACAVTCTNGEGSGVVVPGTGMHLNNMMGESDLSPAGFFSHPPGRRLPSMMAPTVVLRDGVTELALGSAGSNRIRSALLQVIINAVDRGMTAQPAVDAPRMHLEDGTLYAEPGIDLTDLDLTGPGRSVVRFRERNLFFGGCQAVERQRDTGRLSGGGDPRRGGAVVLLADPAATRWRPDDRATET